MGSLQPPAPQRIDEGDDACMPWGVAAGKEQVDLCTRKLCLGGYTESGVARENLQGRSPWREGLYHCV